MTQELRITPSQKLVDKWVAMLEYCEDIDVFTDIARWGADQELEACKEWVSWRHSRHESDELLFARRPKPLSLKEQALQAAQRFYAKGHEDCTDEEVKDDFDTIRRAIESLPD